MPLPSKIFCAFFVGSFLPLSGLAQYSTKSEPLQFKPTLDSIYNNNFAAARQLIDQIPEQENNSTQYKEFLTIFLKRWEFAPIAFSAESETYEQSLEDLLHKLSGTSKNENLYLEASTLLLLAEYHASKGNKSIAFVYAKKAYPLATRYLTTDAPSSEDNFIKGLYLYYIEHYKEKGLFYRTILWPLKSGNKKLGIKLLASTSASSCALQTEATIFSAHILLHFETKPNDALAFTEKLIRKYPNNAKFLELHLENLLECKKYQQASLLINKLSTNSNPYYSCSGNLFEGILAEEYLHDYEKAIFFYSKVINLEAGGVNSIEANRKLARNRYRNLKSKITKTP